MAELTPQQFVDKISQLENNLILIDEAFRVAVKDVAGAMIVRVFEEGLNTSNTKIGSYNNTNPLYVGDNDLPRKGDHKGKPNKDGKSKKIGTTYFSSYKNLREKQGRESGFVNLRLFGRLMSDLANAPVNSQSAGVPSDVNPTRISEFDYALTIRPENKKKMESLEAKYGKVFRHTKQELDRFNKTLKFEFEQRGLL